MFQKIIPVLLSAFLVSGSAAAGQLTKVSGLAGLPAFNDYGSVARNFSPAVKPASYCTRDCTICRDICYQTYRIDCYGPGCRQSFVLCMRDCWYNICRQC